MTSQEESKPPVEESDEVLREKKKLKVAVIGAGPAGLCAARHLASEPDTFDLVVYEQCKEVGGTWLYTPWNPTGKDEDGRPIHSHLYKDLRTNLPKESMAYPDFPYKDKEISYLPSEDVLQYLNDYADHYNLRPYIKLNHIVKEVAPFLGGWSIVVVDHETKLEYAFSYDAVMVCSGPNITPVYPAVEGIAKFSGQQLHSKEYREAEKFTGKRVLVVGVGPSGMDITFQLLPIAKKVFWGHNKDKFPPNIKLPPDVVLKPTVKSLEEKTATFADGTTEEVDTVIYCTGYTYNYPFLSENCGIMTDQLVYPLYKHFINANHPTMSIIGLPKLCPHLYMVDFQVRFFLKHLKSEIKLPNKDEMIEEIKEEIQTREQEGLRKKDFHKLGKERTNKFFEDLATLGNLQPIPKVQLTMFNDAFFRAIRNFAGFRNATYKIIDEENFEVNP